MDHMYQRCWIMRAKVIWKAPMREGFDGRPLLRAILMDLLGTRMEAIACGSDAERFNQGLYDNHIYDFANVGFEPTMTLYRFFWYLDSEYYMSMITHTTVNTPARRIEFPICPSVFMDFNDVYSRPHRTIADVVGLVLHVTDSQYRWSFPRNIPVTDMALMNTC
ncbi:uncharacterized protein LOC133890374 [Phragmites australis]|uniref:uncharacterized protein LOC133890374 n=1 Tax=Phragmites australis TaxID=29695 RepID=UPI002D79ECF8|nr:uncharacterized protein LOC133890374 [Phragmites australis]